MTTSTSRLERALRGVDDGSHTVIAEPRRLTSATSLDNLHGIEPIAEALIKTLAGKARTGRLDEMKALELLQQAVLL
jgi:hypothetical protein